MDKFKFGNRLCSLREEKALSQKELAAILDVSDKAISKWENGQSIPRMETLEKIADVFNVGIDVLLNDNETEMERHRVKRSMFRSKGKGNKRVLLGLGFGSIILVALACIVDTFVYFCFNKSGLADVLLQNIMLLAFPIGLLTLYAFVNSWLLRFISGFKDYYFNASNCVSVENSEHRGLSVLNGVSCILALLPFVIAVSSFDADLSLIDYVIVYSASLVLLTINLLTSEYANITLYFTENGLFEKNIDYGDFYPYAKVNITESNITDINAGKTDKLKIKFTINEKKYKASIPAADVNTVSTYLNLGYEETKSEKNAQKKKPVYYILFGIGALIMAFGSVMFLSNMQMGVQEIDYANPCKEYIALDGETSVVKYKDRLYAFTEQNCAVDVFDMSGNFLYANQVTIHQNGAAQYYLVNDNIYIADRAHNLYRYDLNGSFLGRCVTYYNDDDKATISKYDENDTLSFSFELNEEFAWIVYFDENEITVSGYDYLMTYDGKDFNKIDAENDDLSIASCVNGAVYPADDMQGDFDGVEYFVYMGNLCAGSDNAFYKLHSVSFFSWYRHSIVCCWLTAAFGLVFAFFSTRLYSRIQYKKNNK